MPPTTTLRRVVAPREAPCLALLVAALLHPALARAQSPAGGHVSLLVDHLPNAGEAVELRARVFAERKWDAGEHLRVNLSGFVEGLAADREGSRADAIVRPQDLFVDVIQDRFDLRVGFTRVVWGRLDELQPTDVINPLDVSRFFLEGRSEARLPVALVRGRVFLPAGTSLEAVLVPAFRPGRFDQLDEPRSPFNLARDGPAGDEDGVRPNPWRIERREPAVSLRNLQGGARLAATTGRVDWAVSAFRGFEPFGLYSLAAPGSAIPDGLPPAVDPGLPPPPLAVLERFPRFTMVGGDIETVKREWGLRGEVAVFLEDTFQSPAGAMTLDGRSVSAGAGVDRQAGDYRISGTVLVERRVSDALGDTNVSLIAASDRRLWRETGLVRLFGVYNVADDTAFLRGIATYSVRDNLQIEGSVGWFVGDGDDPVGQFSARDFVYGRLKVYF